MPKFEEYLIRTTSHSLYISSFKTAFCAQYHKIAVVTTFYSAKSKVDSIHVWLFKTNYCLKTRQRLLGFFNPSSSVNYSWIIPDRYEKMAWLQSRKQFVFPGISTYLPLRTQYSLCAVLPHFSKFSNERGFSLLQLKLLRKTVSVVGNASYI